MAARRRRRVPTVWLDWTPEIAELFEPERSGPLFADLADPARVRVYAGACHTTLKATFANSGAGRPGRGTITLRIDRT